MRYSALTIFFSDRLSWRYGLMISIIAQRNNGEEKRIAME